MTSAGVVLLSIPFALTLRNFISTGLAGRLRERSGIEVHLISPFPDAAFVDAEGRMFPNHAVGARPGANGIPTIAGVRPWDVLMKSVHLTGFAIEYPDASLQTLTLSRRRNLQWAAARTLTALAPRGTRRRDGLRRAYARYRPRREPIARLFDALQPALLLVASPGHVWLDHFVLDEARRRGVPSACLVLNWDNLVARGPLCRRPDRLLVWSDEMRRHAIDLHQFPDERVSVVGAVQFVFYDPPPEARDSADVRRRLGLRPDESYLAYVCGAQAATYQAEDVRALAAALRGTRFSHLRIVVRLHPQGEPAPFDALSADGILLDRAPAITAGDSRPDAFDHQAARGLAALLAGADFVVASWGTTALLEACVVDRPALQLRWMSAVHHTHAVEVQLVRDFQRYLHMRAFDATGARPYCDAPADLEPLMTRLLEDAPAFSARRAAAVERLMRLPLAGAVERACAALESSWTTLRSGRC